MWLDFASDGVPGGLTFGFPEPDSHRWTAIWRDIVQRVAITPDAASRDALLDNFSFGRGVRTLGFINAHALNSCVTDPRFANDLLSLDHIVRDGIGVHALYRLIGEHSGLNLNGTDLMPDLIQRFAGQRIALFGTRLPMVERVADKLRREMGCTTVVADGFQRDGFYLELAERERPALIILGMGMPKQERVARLMKHGLHQDVAVVCGGAILDFLSGYRPRAPRWMRHTGLEWMYRLSLEPKRLFGRYVIGNPLFLLRSAILSGRSPQAPPPPQPRPAPRTRAAAFGIGGPLHASAVATTAITNAQAPVQYDAVRASLLPLADYDALQSTIHIMDDNRVVTPSVAGAAGARASVPGGVDAASIGPFKLARSEFSANRPVIDRDHLFGRQNDLDRLISWVLDQSGNALIYGPRGYGKTSLVRVFGEIADSQNHIVLYASCSQNADFGALMRLYLGEIDGIDIATLPAADELTVQHVAARLAGVENQSIVIILDEFDRIARTDTREHIVELIKDVSDLTPAVRFVLVGVATDASDVLGYHPSIHRCITCVPLARLTPAAVDEMFRAKATADGLGVADTLVEDVVRISAGSAYHAQLIGQKLVARARRQRSDLVSGADLDAIIAEIVTDASLMDLAFARLAQDVSAQPGQREALVLLARRALGDPNDVLHCNDTDAQPHGYEMHCRALADTGILRPTEAGLPLRGWRFANAFLPQLVLMIDHLAARHAA